MSRVNQTIVLTAILLATITATALYIHVTNPQTIEDRLLVNMRKELGTPDNAEYLGVKTYNVSNKISTVYSWRNDTTLYEAQITPEGKTKTFTYTLNPDEVNSTISPYLAESLAESLLIEKSEDMPEAMNITGPSVYYQKGIGDNGDIWRVSWGVEIGDYPVLGADFVVRVFPKQGKASIYHNSLDSIHNISIPTPPLITEEEAIETAKKAYLKQLEYPVIQSITVRELGVSISGFPDIPPNALIWNIVIQGMGYENGNMVWTASVYSIDAHSGESYGGSTVGAGISWTSGYHPYYGSAYPITLDRYPADVEFPIDIETAWDHIFNYTENRTPRGLALEYIILQLDEDDKPVIVSYWARRNGGYKTGTLFETKSLNSIQSNSMILDGYLLVLDAETGQLIKEIEYNNIGEPENTLNITREQAINITATSPLADPEDKIIEPEALVSAEPRIIKPDWERQLTNSGDIRRLYIADNNQTEPRIYWIVRYVNTPEAHGGFTGTYLVDAETGDIALALEDYPLIDILVRGYAPDQIKVNGSGVFSFNVTVKAEPTLEAELPVSIEAVNLPENVTIIIDNPVRRLSTGKDAIFNVTARVGELAEIGLHNIRFEISYLDKITSAYTKFEITKTRSAFNVEPRKPVFRIGEIITFNIRSPSPQTGANITITNPQGDIVWIMKLSEGWIDIGESWALPYYQQVSNKELMVLREEHSLGNWTWTYRYQNITVNGGFTIKEYKEYPFGEISEMGGYPTIKDDISDVALIAVPAIESQVQPIYSEHESGPGPAVARDSADSNPFWVPVITTIIVAAYVYLINRKR